MARKAVNGYPEKSYYDNTTFGGIVATGDPLNEGSFALITNFNITDSGKSVVPRDGYISTTIKIDDKDIILSNRTLVYRDPKISRDIVIDLSNITKESPFAYIVDISPYTVNNENNKLFTAKVITNYDTNDVVNIINSMIEKTTEEEHEPISFKTIISNSEIVGNYLLQPIMDKNAVTYYITKLKFTYNEIELSYWIKIMYREKGTKHFPGDDTLVISVVDVTQQTSNLTPRNIASTESVVPDPMRTQELQGTSDTSITNIVKAILVETDEGYTTTKIDNKYKNALDIKLNPLFHLQDPSRILNVEDTVQCKWAYRFTVVNNSDVSSDLLNGDDSLPSLYKTPWYYLDPDKTIEGDNVPIEKLMSNNRSVTPSYANDYIYIMIPTKDYLRTLTPALTTVQQGTNDPYIDTENSCTLSNFTAKDFIEFKKRNEAHEALMYEYSRGQTSEWRDPDDFNGYVFSGNYEQDLKKISTIEETNPLSLDFDNTDLGYNFISQSDIIAALVEDFYDAADKTPTADETIDEAKARVRKRAITQATKYFNNSMNRTNHFEDSDFGMRPVSMTPGGPVHLAYVLQNLYSADTTVCNTSMLVVSQNNLEKHAKFLTFNQLQEHVKENAATSNVCIVPLPCALQTNFKVQSTYLENGVTKTHSKSNIHYAFCKLTGAFITGMRNNPAGAINRRYIPSWGMFLLTLTEKFKTTYRLQTWKQINLFSNLNNLVVADLPSLGDVPRDFFSRGIVVVMYLKPYHDGMLDMITDDSSREEVLKIDASWEASAYGTATAMAFWAEPRDVTYIQEYDTENPFKIIASTNYTVFEDRIVTWSGNEVFISEEGDYYFFTELLRKTFPEEVLKVLPYKTILLVFTSQNLYAIHRVEGEVDSGEVDSEGNAITTKSIIWLQQPVLYNINPDRKYLDVIQVFNQMVLFYSAEGQLYMIKPSATIDSETQFGIQYFNKSANHILANYEEYINERLKVYGKLEVDNQDDYVTKDQVIIKALLDIDVIKVFYCVPNRITLILLYDVVNNRYTTYDTLSFTQIEAIKHVEGGEAYLTKESSNSYFTLPIKASLGMDNNVDMHYQDTFRKEPIFSLLDTGTLNLNNHLTKRMRDLRVTLKNIDATKILYNAEVMMDDSIIRPFYSPDFKVKMTNGPDHTMKINATPQDDIDDLFGMNKTIGIEGTRTDIHSTYLYYDKDFFNRYSLLKTETINSSKLIEYNSSILSMGKNVRLKMQFISKGKYKLQSFGILYKERKV